MKESNHKWHLDVLSTYQNLMFDSLIYTHNLITDTVKEFTLIDKKGEEWTARGYLAIKDIEGRKVKYFIQEPFFEFLPIRAEEIEEFFLQDSTRVKSIACVVKNPTPFRIKAEKTFEDNHGFVDGIAPFEHSNPDMWTLNKLVALSGLICKTFVGVCSEPEFGKSSIYELLHSITKISPVFQPRSVPGILAQVTSVGNIVFDEVSKSNAEVKMCMENFVLQVGGGKPVYINGALQSHNTKQRYDVSGQSITFLYNVYKNYKKPDEEFFDFIFSNNDAVDSRLLKLKLDGILVETFDKDFDMIHCAEENRLYYIKVAKHLLFLKNLKSNNSYKKRYRLNLTLDLKGRKRIIFDEIAWLIDVYANSQEEFDKFITLLEKAIINYKEMLGDRVFYAEQKQLTEETKSESVVVEDIVDEPPSPCHICGAGKSVKWDRDKGICEDCAKVKKC